MNEMNDHRKAISYLESSVKLLQQSKSPADALIWAKLNLAVSYNGIREFDKAKKTLDEVGALHKKIPKNQFLTIYCQHLADHYILVKKNDSALAAANTGIDYAKKLKIPYDVQTLSFTKFKILRAEKRLAEAENIMKEILSSVEFDNENNRMNYVKEMAKLQEEMGNHQSANQYLLQYISLRDEADKELNRKNTLELEAKYNTSQKEKQLLELENRSKMQRTVLILSLVIAAALISFFLYAMNQRKKRNRNEMIRIEQERKLDFSKALLEGEEQERKRIARELHDGLGGRITGVKLSLENSEMRENQAVKNNIRQLEEILNEVRQTARNLMPESIQKSGLQAAIQDYCCEMSSGDVQICFYSDPLDQIVERKDQINIYRIVQELITNGIRHGEASKILLNIAMQHPMLLIDYEDDGKGFDTMQQKRNLGMNNIENRALNMRGTAHWVSEPGKGTSVNIQLHI